MAAESSFRDIGLSILGVGRQYPQNGLLPNVVDILAKRYHPDSPAMKKVLAINRYTGIDTRSSVGDADHPVVNQPTPPSIAELHKWFISDGVPLAVSAARKAMAEARVGGTGQEPITHMVSTTCTDSANPGFDHYVARELGLSPETEKVLLHGVGCSGGLAALRTAANLALGHTMRGLPARILVVGLEVCTPMVRSELESVDALQETRIGLALFSDCGSAVLLSNGVEARSPAAIAPALPVYDLLGWNHRIIPDTEGDLGFDVDPQGWKVVLSPRVPQLTTSMLTPSYESLMASLPPLPSKFKQPSDFDWAMHPGGSTILTGAERLLGITPEHQRASYDTYINHGNSSSATIFSVLDRLREKDMDALTPGGRPPSEYVIGCAFGPGISVETCMLRRHLRAGGYEAPTPPETESEASRSDNEEDDYTSRSLTSSSSGSQSRISGGEDDRTDLIIDAGLNAAMSKPAAGGLRPHPEVGGPPAKHKESEIFISEALAEVELD